MIAIEEGDLIMSPFYKTLALVLCGATLAAFTTSAFAKPKHGRRGDAVSMTTGVADDRFSAGTVSGAAPTTVSTTEQVAGTAASAERSFAAAESGANADGTPSVDLAQGATPHSVVGGSSSVVDEARRYIGGNPTGRGSLWCGAFMDMVLKRTGHPGGGNLARAYARYGTRVSGPQVGAIAVMGRNGGGHVGVVSGVDANGNPIIISGNHNRRVAESVYPKGRIIAYVMPN